MIAAAVAAAVVGSVLAVTSPGGERAEEPAVTNPPKPATAPNGWVAIDDGDIHLLRPGEGARRLEVPGSAAHTEVCPAWSPDGSRLMVGRYTGTLDRPSGTPELVVVPVASSGATGAPAVIPLAGFPLPEPGRFYRPCGVWAPDGRWVALAGTGDVWLVDTQTGRTRRLPDLRPSDLAWRPGTDELAIAGDMGSASADPTSSTPVTVYSVSTGKSRRLGSFTAAHISWAPDGSALAYTGGEEVLPELWVVDHDGSNPRQLVQNMGAANHGIGPEWSPRGDRIVYQRLVSSSGERHEVVLVDVTDGTETVISPPSVDRGRKWYPRSVSWSPDGTALLYPAWFERDDRAGDAGGGVIVVLARKPGLATLLTEGLVPTSSGSTWAPNQLWGRQPD
jgi:TolB protein